MEKRNPDTSLDDLVQAGGFNFELLHMLARAVMRQGGTKADLRRIIDDPIIQERVASVLLDREGPAVVGPSMELMHELPPHHYIINVKRGPLTSDKVIPPREFANVPHLSIDRDITNTDERRRPCRVGINDLFRRSVLLLVKIFSEQEVEELGGDLTNDAAIQWGLERGWHPAVTDECYAVGQDLSILENYVRQFMVGLGSVHDYHPRDHMPAIFKNQHGWHLTIAPEGIHVQYPWRRWGREHTAFLYTRELQFLVPT